MRVCVCEECVDSRIRYNFYFLIWTKYILAFFFGHLNYITKYNFALSTNVERNANMSSCLSFQFYIVLRILLFTIQHINSIGVRQRRSTEADVQSTCETKRAAASCKGIVGWFSHHVTNYRTNSICDCDECALCVVRCAQSTRSQLCEWRKFFWAATRKLVIRFRID